MAQGQSNQLEAAIRFYGDPTNTVHLVNPALIADFITVENFNFNIPHTLFQIKDGLKTELPIQVFEISANKEELLNPKKRRIFEKKRRSDVMAEIIATREKREIEEKKKGKLAHRNEKEAAVSAKQDHVPTASNHSKAQDLKAIEKKIKEDAKNYAKSTDKEILTTKLKKIDELKLSYVDDSSELEMKQKEINDLNTKNILKAQELAEMKKKHEEEMEILKAKLQKNSELLLRSKAIIQNLQDKSTSLIAEQTVPFVEKAVQEESIALETISTYSKEPSSLHMNLNPYSVVLRDVSSSSENDNLDSSKGEFSQERSLDQGHDECDIDNYHKSSKTKHKFSSNTDKNQGLNSTSMMSINQAKISDMKGIDFDMNLPSCSQPSCAVASTNKNFPSSQNNEMDDDDVFFKEVLSNNTKTIQKNASETFVQKRKPSSSNDDDTTKKFSKNQKSKKSRGLGHILDSDSDKENQKTKRAEESKRKAESRSDEKSVKKDDLKKRHSKTTHDRYAGTKKYKMMESSDSDSDPDVPKKRRRYTRASDDDYQSDFLTKSDKPNYKSYTEEDGKQRHMIHLKHNICIRYKWWNAMKTEFDMKEWIRLLLHAMFKEEDLIDKVFKIGACKSERLPGRSRTEFTLDEKAVIRTTFFCKVDEVIRSKREAKFHKDHWKTYVSEHINALIEAEKKSLQRRQAAQNKKKKAQQAGRQQESSFSSEDA